MKKITFLLTALVCLSVFFSFAQVSPVNWCATDKMRQENDKKNPAEAVYLQNLEMQLQQMDAAAFKSSYGQAKPTGTVYIIPVVFHIVHAGGPENISMASVKDAIRTINEDFRKRNDDTVNTLAKFKGIAADAEIEVRLATIDPSGKCTNGIDRIYNPTAADDGGAPSFLNPWPSSKYLNIWTVRKMNALAGAAGYTNQPTGSSKDGIIMDYTYIGVIQTGSIYKRHALPHEVGHYFSLSHTWGGSNTPGVSCGDDGVSDTPITKGYLDCTDINGAHCTAGVVENVQNFMEYSYCSTMFTQGQKTRMRNALTTNSVLAGLYTTSNLAATGATGTPTLCAADFSIGAIDTICIGTSVNFTDVSYNSTITTWSWTFPGGTPASSTIANPSVVYNTPGVYNASLTVGDGTTTKSVTRNNILNVRGPIGNQYTQNFEGYTFPGADFSVVNRDNGATWTKTTSVGFSGTSSVVITGSPSGQVDDLIGPGVNMSVMSSAEFSFRVAYAQKSSSTADKLQVYLSTDCGLSWAQRYVKSGASLATAPVTAGAFTPTSAQWRKDVVGLTNAFTGKTDVQFLFRFTSAGGNSIYIDDINIVDLMGVKEDEFGSKIGLTIYPNPVEESAVIAFRLMEKTSVQVKVIDMLGRDVATIADQYLAEGENSFTVSKETTGLKPGVYFVKLMLGNNRSYAQKMIIQ